MAMINPVITNAMDVCSNNDKDLNKNEHIGNNDSNVFIATSICNNESIYNQKHKGKVEENSRETVCDGISSSGGNISYSLENLQSNKILNDQSVKNGHPDDKTNLNKARKSVEVRTNDKYALGGNENEASQKILRKLLILVDSDSEDEINMYKTSNEELFTVDEDNHSGYKCSQITRYKRSLKNKNTRRIADSTSEDEETSNIHNSQTSHQTTSIITDLHQTLIDPESEESETISTSAIFDDTGTLEIMDAKRKSIKKGSIRASKNEAMRKIHSESQRLLRETGISLPYHNPKQRTLQEFLNRKKLASLPKAPSTAAKLKMSSTIVSQILEEKEKEAELFYKSSDSEDDTHEAKSFTCENVKKYSVANEEKLVPEIDLVYAQDMQDIGTNPDSLKREIMQKDNMNTVARKILFENDSCAADYQVNDHVLGLPLPKFTDDISIDRKKLLSKFAPNSKVTLKGSPGMIIDLTDDVKPNSKGLNSLLDRFFRKHVNTKKQTDNMSEVTAIHLQDTENDSVPVKELPFKLPTSTDNSELNKPGAKLMRLKEHLKLQMSLKRNEEWKQKEIELQMQKKEDEEDETDYNLDKQEEADILESSDSGESEPEENDVCIKDKKKKKCLFADDEADVTDNENSDAYETDTDEAEHSKQSTSFKYGNEKNNTDDSESDMEEAEDTDEDKNENEFKSETEFMDKDKGNVVIDKSKNINVAINEKRRKRLIQRYQDDSENEDSQLKSIVEIHTSKVASEDGGWMSENESNMQQRSKITTKSQICKTPLPIVKTTMLDFVSPITQLSILNTSFDSDTKEMPKNTQSDQSPHCAHKIRNKSISQKKLFYDVEENVDDEYLMQLCSTKFESTQKSDFNVKDLTSQFDTTESQLREFDTENSDAKLNDVKELKSLEAETKISQKIDLFNTHSSVYHTKKLEVGTTGSELKSKIVPSIVPDDEEELDEEDTFLRPKKRLTKRLDLSDSEDEDAGSSNKENDSANNEETEEKYIDYDSEENEVIVVPKKDVRKVAADFLEEEAELSESDWDSADEDEKDLDKLDFEEADEEHIDEDKMKDQLGKIHMKQMLDEDKRNVRLLKELLFEDGDLHTDGTGRERKFKWRNIDKLENDIEKPQMLDKNDGWVDVEEDEEEAKWNKFRQERDKFLEERMETLNNKIEDDLCDSQIFKFGLKTLKKVKNESEKQVASPDKVDLLENTEPIMPRNITDLLHIPSTGKKSQTIYNIMKRRSLLTRGEQSLARIASLAKQSDGASHMVNRRNFVFQYIDPRVNNTSKKEEMRERERNQIFQNQSRKRNITSDFSSATKKKRK